MVTEYSGTIPKPVSLKRAVSLSAILRHLLADIRVLTGIPLGVPYEDMDNWVLKEGPQLDKDLLVCIERMGVSMMNASIPVVGAPEFPLWLKPLWDEFCSSRSPTHLGYIRQILVFGYKTEQPSTKDQINEAFKSFVETDECVALWDLHHEDLERDFLFRESRKIISRITARCNFMDVTGRHGPGGTYPSRAAVDKSAFDTYYDPIREFYGYSEYYHCLPSFWDSIGRVRDRDFRVSDRIVAKITAVPKDSRGPRLICVHPAESIWLQLGQSDVLCRAIERHPLSRGRVSFRDQTLNGSLALQSSFDRALCTLDLKEASDRVSCKLVRHQLGDFQYGLLSCSRARFYTGLDGETREMKKWAPMGNGLTFPIESLLFYSLVVAGIRLRYGVNCNEVYVFGDDILFPTKYYDGAVNALVRAGLVPNSSKTFRFGFFRESCGVDAFFGVNITPVRVRKGTRLASYTDGVSVCELAKRLRLRQYHRTATYLYALVAQRFGELPLSNNPDYSAIYEYRDVRFSDLYLDRRNAIWHSSYQLWGTKARSVRAADMLPSNGDWYHLQDSLLRLGRQSPLPEIPWEEWSREVPIRTGYSERGLVYPHPYRVRSYKGFIPHILKE